MANITNFLNKIKTAVHGKDVRGAIHDAIKQVYDDASVEHDNANMEVKLARGTHNTLNDRLDNVDEIQAQTNAQLSETKQELNSQLEHNAGIGVIAKKNYGDGITDASDYIQSLINQKSNTIYIPTPSNFYLLKKKITIPYSGYGISIKVRGSARLGTGIFRVDNTFTDTTVFEITGDTCTLENLSVTNIGELNLTGISILTGAKHISMVKCLVSGFAVGIEYNTYYCNFEHCMFLRNKIGLRCGNANTCGSLAIYGGHFKNNGIDDINNGCAIYLLRNGSNTNGITLRDVTFESNRRHLINDGGTILLDTCYIGDGSGEECILQRNGVTTIDGKNIQSIQGAGGSAFIDQSDKTIFTCGVKIEGGKINLLNTNLNNNSHCNIGVSNGTEINGTGILLNDGELYTQNVKGLDWKNFIINKSSSNKMQPIKSYIINGNLKDFDNISSSFPVKEIYRNDNGFGGNIVKFTNNSTNTNNCSINFSYTVPSHKVNTVMYFVIILSETTGTYNTRVAPLNSCFTAVINDKNYPAYGNVSTVSGNYSLSGSVYKDNPRIAQIPILINSESGTIQYRVAYPTSNESTTATIFGAYLIDSEFAGILGKYYEN